jgi:hypothetical protein
MSVSIDVDLPSTIQKFQRMINTEIGRETYHVKSIDGNKIVYDNKKQDGVWSDPIETTLGAFLRLEIPTVSNSNRWKYLPIGEVYSFFPDRNEDNDEDSYEETVNEYCSELDSVMEHQGLLVKLSNTKGGRKTYHKRNNKKKKRTYKRRK